MQLAEDLGRLLAHRVIDRDRRADPSGPSSSFLGLIADSNTAIPADFAGVKVSIVFIQAGNSGAASPRGRPRHCLTASSTNTNPSTILRMLTHVAGAPSLLADAPLEISSTITPTTARPTTQPDRNAGPFTRPFGVASISTTAMIGTGLSATPTPNENT